MDEEQLILVDADDREVGVCEKLEAHRRGLMHRAFSVILYDGDRILLQRRHHDKYHSGGLWANAACGHPRPHEPTPAAAQRRLYEEMGLKCPLRWSCVTHYRAVLDGGMVENEIVHLFVGEYSGDPTPDPLEVIDWRWQSLEHFRRVAATSPEYTYWVAEYVRRRLI